MRFLQRPVCTLPNFGTDESARKPRFLVLTRPKDGFRLILKRSQVQGFPK